VGKGKNKKADFELQVRVMTQPHIESFVYGFLQSRGFDLYPRIRETREGYVVALYFDRDDKGWRRTFQLELGGKENPAHFALAVALVNHLYNSGVQPRTPAPMGEIVCKVMRNEILGQLQDGINEHTSLRLLNDLAGNMTRHLRAMNMQIDFGDDEPVEEIDEGDVDPVLEAELDAMERAIEEEEGEADTALEDELEGDGEEIEGRDPNFDDAGEPIPGEE
jgi:hypothetical protein